MAQGTARWPVLMPLPPVAFEAVIREGTYRVSLAIDVESHAGESITGDLMTKAW